MSIWTKVARAVGLLPGEHPAAADMHHTLNKYDGTLYCTRCRQTVQRTNELCPAAVREQQN